MQKNYSYPLDLSWSTEELASVLSFFNKVEEAYESKVEAKEYMEAYRAFKKVVPSIGEEKRLGSEWLFSLSCDPGCKAKRGRMVFS